jgi:hypothetical protein
MVTLTTGGPVQRTIVTVAIYGAELDPDEVSALLGCSPTEWRHAGDKQAPGSPANKRGAWFLSTEVHAPEGAEEATTTLLRQLPRDDALWKRLSDRFEVQVRYGIFMSGWNRGFELSSASIDGIARLRALMFFDIYADDEDAG